MRSRIGGWLSLMLLIGCRSDIVPSVAPSATVTTQPTARAATNPIATGGPTATALRFNTVNGGRSRYQFEIDFDQARRQAVVTQTVQVVNATGQPLDEILFVIEPNRQAGVFRLSDVLWSDGRRVQDYALDRAQLRVPLPKRLDYGSSVTLSLHYTLDMPEQVGPFGFTSQQINFGDWYPFVPAYRAGQGWLIHEPGAVGEHLVYDVADYRVKIRLVNSALNSIIAASAPAAMSDGWHQYQLDAARNFTWSIVTDYQAISQTVGAITVQGYVLPRHLDAGRAALQATVQAVKVYSELFAPYPHSQLSFVEADFPDGMEYDGLYFLGPEYFEGYQGNPQGYLTAIAVHETAHQWWYALVGNDQAVEPWLDEALATYSESLFYEHTYPDLVKWWWQFRVKRFNPTGNVDSTIYDHDSFRPYVNAVYLRGALFLDEVRRQMGDEAFFEFLRKYAAEQADMVTSGEEFWAVLTMHQGINSSELKAEYFHH